MTSIQSGGLLVLDPSDSLPLQFTWDDRIASTASITASAWTITAIRQNGATALTNDSATIAAGSRNTLVRLVASTASEGDLYWVENKITTDESPAMIVEQGFKVLIQNRR